MSFWRVSFFGMVTLLNVIQIIVILLIDVHHRVILLNIIFLNVFLPLVIRLNVVAPWSQKTVISFSFFSSPEQNAATEHPFKLERFLIVFIY
jgi:hypothetical protein